VHDKAQPPADEFLSDTLLAQRLNVSPAHVWHMASRNIIPQPYRLGRAARWRWSEVLSAIELTQVGPDEHEVQRLNEARAAARARKQSGAAS
jgi:predicted DNA-binding transcriptional regulator AlpA